MNFDLRKEYFLDDGTKRILIKIPPDELMYFGYFIEGFEGWCSYTTIKKQESLLQVDVAPDFVPEFGKLLDCLKKWES